MKWTIFMIVASMIIIYGVCFAEETTVSRVSDYSARITVSNVSEKEGTKTTVSQERTFTLEELQKAKEASEQALKSWNDNKAKCDENIVLQTNQVALWTKLIEDTKASGVIEKPIEKPIEEVKPVEEITPVEDLKLEELK